MTLTGPNVDPQLLPSYEFLPPTDERLYMPSEPIPPELITSPEIQGYAEDLLAICRGERATNLDVAHMVGLALPQFGIMKNMFIVDMGFEPYENNPRDLHVFINSEIVEESPETEDQYDGCFSIPPTVDGAEIFGVVPRPKWLRARAYNLQGLQETLRVEGFTARIYKHEDDHVNGVVFPQRMDSGKLLDVVMEDEIAAYGRESGWEKGWHRHLNPEDVIGHSSAA